MSARIHRRIESIAGAIALGEATDAERSEYRLHLSTCVPCMNALGGEYELERVAATVASARGSEVWEPDVRHSLQKRFNAPVRVFRYGAVALAGAIALTFAVRTMPVPGTAAPHAAKVVAAVHAAPVIAAPVVAPPVHPERRLVVVHNVVQLTRAPVAQAAAPQVQPQKLRTKPGTIAAVIVHPDRAQLPPEAARVPAFWHTVAQTTTTSLSETAPQALAATHAEALQLGAGAIREAMPIGGATAIAPQPPMIAYDEGAQGTSVFEVRIDSRGVPLRCVITKSSGWTVLDDTVCKAAMKAHYLPKTIGGRPVAGVYQDAFTFQSSVDPAVEGAPEQIH